VPAPRDPARPLSLLALYPLFFVAVYLGHFTLLRLPYFWDEGGYYIPAALDFFRTGTLIPVSTITNAHPPLPSLLLAAAWHVTGYVVSGTRTFVCLFAAAALLAVYKLARHFLGELAAAAVAFLTAVYPIWYVQSTLAHADIFAATFTLWALAFYFTPPPTLPLSNCHPELSSSHTDLRPLSTFHPAIRPLSTFHPAIRPLSNCHPELSNCHPELSNCHPELSNCHPERSEGPASSPQLDKTLPSRPEAALLPPQRRDPQFARTAAIVALFFTLSALSKETAILTPLTLALHRLYLAFSDPKKRRHHLLWAATLASCILPLAAWYAFHFHRTGYIFGNPEFLRYNATANLDAHRIALSLYHRFLHLFAHMNMAVATLLAATCLLLPRRLAPAIPRPTLITIALILAANWLAFSILGGALLTRYFLPMYPLILMLCVAVWRAHTRLWPALTALTAAAFLYVLHVNPPYAFAPEDNLTYRDMIVLHQQAVGLIAAHFPQATVLTAWPANAELSRPELGYLRSPIKVVTLQNFTLEELQKGQQSPGDFDTALLFSTKYVPPAGRTNLTPNLTADARYFDFRRDLSPAEAAHLLHGDILWQRERNGEWAAILRFPRTFEAHLTPQSSR
jgi:4-amino-4-deoxy-L-arabinose transferase-like glycosyltransferase